jgi:hypothetical protein
MSVGRAKLSEKQELAISALLTERTHELAAEKAGISPATITRWLRDESFRLAYRQARRAVVEGTIATLQRAGAAAAEALTRALTCQDHAVEIRAAALILEHGFKGIEVLDLAERVEELEGLLAEIRNGDEPEDDTPLEDAGRGEDAGAEPPAAGPGAEVSGC